MGASIDSRPLPRQVPGPRALVPSLLRPLLLVALAPAAAAQLGPPPVPADMGIAAVGVVPCACSMWRSSSPNVKATIAFLGPLLLAAALCVCKPELKASLCDGAMTCNQVKSLMAGAGFVWLSCVKALAKGDAEPTGSKAVEVATAKAAKAA